MIADASAVPAGAEASHPGSGRRLPVCGVVRDGSHRLRVGLADARPEPVAVGVARLLSLRSAPPGRHRKAEGAAVDGGEQQHR